MLFHVGFYLSDETWETRFLKRRRIAPGLFGHVVLTTTIQTE